MYLSKEGQDLKELLDSLNITHPAINRDEMRDHYCKGMAGAIKLSSEERQEAFALIKAWDQCDLYFGLRREQNVIDAGVAALHIRTLTDASRYQISERLFAVARWYLRKYHLDEGLEGVIALSVHDGLTKYGVCMFPADIPCANTVEGWCIYHLKQYQLMVKMGKDIGLLVPGYINARVDIRSYGELLASRIAASREAETLMYENGKEEDDLPW